MKSDIKFLPVENVHVAVAKEQGDLKEDVWNVYLLNKSDFWMDNILVTSKGYGTFNDEKQETSVLRRHFDRLGPGEHLLIEPIDPAVFHLNNEYWVSYWLGKQVYDKKFIFLPESIINENLIHIPELNTEGILHS